jgi:drug/metabolite transporter (DMT)-like permease
MHLKSKKTSLIILAITALMLSRLMFVLFNDPEGPNLVVIIGAAAILYLLSFIAYVYNLSESKKLLLAIFIQIVIVTGLSIFLK